MRTARQLDRKYTGYISTRNHQPATINYQPEALENMSPITGPIEFAGRKLVRLVTHVQHLRHYRRTLRRGAVEKGAAREARASAWWGNEPRWYAAGTPPRLHNHITPLIDGESFFNALQQCLSEARHYVYIAGWCLTPYIPLVEQASRPSSRPVCSPCWPPPRSAFL